MLLSNGSEALETTMKHVCTTANRIQKNVVEFVQNVDWKKGAIGVGVTLAVAGLAVATGGIGLAAAGPVLMGAAMGAGTGSLVGSLYAGDSVGKTGYDFLVNTATQGGLGGGITTLGAGSGGVGETVVGYTANVFTTVSGGISDIMHNHVNLGNEEE